MPITRPDIAQRIADAHLTVPRPETWVHSLALWQKQGMLATVCTGWIILLLISRMTTFDYVRKRRVYG